MAKPKSKPKPASAGNSVCLREPDLLARVCAEFARREDGDRSLASMVRKLLVEALAYQARERRAAAAPMVGMSRDEQAATREPAL